MMLPVYCLNTHTHVRLEEDFGAIKQNCIILNSDTVKVVLGLFFGIHQTLTTKVAVIP